MMEFDLTSYNGEDIPEINISVEANNKFFVFYKDTRIGSFNFYTFTFDINAVYFHSFNIYKKYRNRGLGKISMSAILLYLKNSGKTKIYLQLLLENTPAFKIYTKLGFKTASEISYYKKCHSLKTE